LVQLLKWEELDPWHKKTTPLDHCTASASATAITTTTTTAFFPISLLKEDRKKKMARFKQLAETVPLDRRVATAAAAAAAAAAARRPEPTGAGAGSTGSAEEKKKMELNDIDDGGLTQLTGVARRCLDLVNERLEEENLIRDERREPASGRLRSPVRRIHQIVQWPVSRTNTPEDQMNRASDYTPPPPPTTPASSSSSSSSSSSTRGRPVKRPEEVSELFCFLILRF